MRKIILATLILGICSVVFAVGCQNSSDKIWAPKLTKVVQEKEIDTREIMDEWERYREMEANMASGNVLLYACNHGCQDASKNEQIMREWERYWESDEWRNSPHNPINEK